MKGLDTNMLIRFLVGDDQRQAKVVYNILKEAEASKSELFVPFGVVLELVWVLESIYAVSREQIVDSLYGLLKMPTLVFEHRTPLQNFLRAASQNNFDLSDLLIAHSAHHQGCEKLMTFDKKAAKFEMFELATAH